MILLILEVIINLLQIRSKIWKRPLKQGDSQNDKQDVTVNFE